MSVITKIARKEFIDTLRDRRTVIIMVLMPTLLFPAIFFLMTTVQKNAAAKAKAKTLKVGIVADLHQDDWIQRYEEADTSITMITGVEADSAHSLIRSDSLDALVHIPAKFDEALNEYRTGRLTLYYQGKDINDNQIKNRLLRPIERYEKDVLDDRMDSLQITNATIDPIRVKESNVATGQEVMGNIIGGLVPYLFVIFAFMGSMYPAIDLFTGEKERSTLETILTTPVNRLQIFMGKMIVVASTGLITALLALLSISISLQFIDLPSQFSDSLSSFLEPGPVLLLLSLLIPLCIFFAGVESALASYSKSFKEAQSTLSPLSIAVILPAAAALMPGIEYNLVTALVPILNVALASKEILAGTVDYGLLMVTYASLILLAGIAIVFSVNWFVKESNILRT